MARVIQYNPRAWQILAEGSERQRQAFRVLSESALGEVLKPFDPAHVGTIGNGLYTEHSDIDLICSCGDFAELERVLREQCPTTPILSVKITEDLKTPHCTINLQSEIPIEIYAEDLPLEQQSGYRHYMIACRLIDLLGEDIETHVRTLKREGLKTELAFCQVLGLAGEPYQAFLNLEEMSNEALQLLYLSHQMHLRKNRGE